MGKTQISESERELLSAIKAAMEDTKAEDITVLGLKELGAFTDYLVIGGATSDRQVNAIAERITAETKKKLGRRPLGVEGTQMGQWVLIDYGEVVCHVFLNEVREFYRLEEMWSDAERPSLEKQLPMNKATPKKTAPQTKKKAPAKAKKSSSPRKPVKKTKTSPKASTAKKKPRKK